MNERRVVVLSVVLLIATMLVRATAFADEQPTPPAPSSATAISDDTLRELAAVATNRSLHPLRVEDATGFLSRFGQAQRHEATPDLLQFSATKQPQLKVEINYSSDPSGKWTDPECIFYIIDPPKNDGDFEVLEKLLRGTLGKPWKVKKERGKLVNAAWNFKKTYKVWLSRGVSAVPDSRTNVEHVELMVSKPSESFED